MAATSNVAVVSRNETQEARHFDALIIGGAMANTFLFAQGKSVGKSLVEADLSGTARNIMDKAKAAKREIVLPAFFSFMELLRQPGYLTQRNLLLFAALSEYQAITCESCAWA